MKDLSLYVLDIAMNSINADAKSLQIIIDIKHSKDLMTISIIDDGCGIDGKLLKVIFDPFTTTRKERRVGLGLSLFKEIANQCDGDVHVTSKLGAGTSVIGTFKTSSIDLPPIGNMAHTIVSLIIANKNLNLTFNLKVDDKNFSFDTTKIKKILGDVNMTEISILHWISEYLKENIETIMEV